MVSLVVPFFNELNLITSIKLKIKKKIKKIISRFLHQLGNIKNYGKQSNHWVHELVKNDLENFILDTFLFNGRNEWPVI